MFRAVQYAVRWGLAHRDQNDVTALGIDKFAWQKGSCYPTLVYQIDAGMKRLLWVGTECTELTLHQFFGSLRRWITATLKYVCSHMWKQYLHIIRVRAGDAVHIIERHHIMAKMNRALDNIRAAEAKQLKRDGH